MPATIDTRLCCPACHGRLNASFQCEGCGKEFPQDDGVPMFLTTPLSAELEEEARWYDAPPRQFSRGHSLAHTRARLGITGALRRLGIRAGHTVLSIGCGPGYDVDTVLPVTNQVVGIDIAAPAVRQFRKNLGLPAYVADCGKMPFVDSSFDAVLVSGVLHHLAGHDGLQPYLREFARVLRPGGALVVVEPNRLYPVQWVVAPVNDVMQKIRPGWRGLVPHERPLTPGFMTSELTRGGFVDVRYTSSTFLHNRVPYPLGRMIAAIEGPFCRTWPLKMFGWWLTVEARK